MLYLFPIETPESGVFGSSHDSVIRTIEGLFMAATPESSTTLLVIWHAFVTSREECRRRAGNTSWRGTNIDFDAVRLIMSSVFISNI